MSVLVMPQSVRQSMRVVAQASESVAVHQLVKLAVSYLIGKLTEAELKQKAREAQVPWPTFSETIDCLCWVLCEAVRCKCTTDQFREFVAETGFLNTHQVLTVYDESIGIIRKCLVEVSPGAEHFVRLDWRIQVEFARRALRGFKRPHVVMNLKTGGGTFTVEASPAMLVELHDTLETALQSCRTAQFRRIQRFVK
jgi:hypothetical protein